MVLRWYTFRLAEHYFWYTFSLAYADRAINIIERSQKLVGGRIIIVECENKDSLLEFYEEHGFESLQVNNSNGLLQLIRNYYK